MIFRDCHRFSRIPRDFQNLKFDILSPPPPSSPSLFCLFPPQNTLNSWKSLKISENPWKSLKISENLWKSLKIPENLWGGVHPEMGYFASSFPPLSPPFLPLFPKIRQIPEKAWKSLKKPQKASKSLKKPQKVWKPLRRCLGSEIFRLFQAFSGFFRLFQKLLMKFLKKPEKAWKSLKKSEKVWKSLKMFGVVLNTPPAPLRS